MELILYSFMFILGILCGSFYTLGTHRIPKREDILYTNSYCPNCNHKLGFLDLIPVFSYIFIGGKCRYCEQKIKIKYLLYEIMAGLSFVALGYLMNLNIFNWDFDFAVKVMFIVLYSSLIYLAAGIDKQYKNIEKSVVSFGILISILYIVYLCIVENANMYRYIIYIVMYMLILFLDTIKLKKYAKNSYINNIILFMISLMILTGEPVAIITIISSMILVGINLAIGKRKFKDKTIKEVYKNIPIGYIIACSNYIVLLIVLWINKLVYTI